MSDMPRFVIVEDREDDRNEIFNQLADAGFGQEDYVGYAATFDDAKDLLTQHCEEIGVAFLDLNIPRGADDPRPSSSVGESLLDIIAHDLNRRANVDISVIIVSGEDIAANESHADLLRRHYAGTLCGVVQKAVLPRMLRSSVKRLLKDELRMHLRKFHVDVLLQYECLIDPSNEVGERLRAARSIATVLMMNEIDFRNGKLGSCQHLADDLRGLLDEVARRFSGDGRIAAADIQTAGGWGGFLWRGYLPELLWMLNNLRNEYIHVRKRPFSCVGADPDEWTIPPNVMASAVSGSRLGQIAELAVRQLIEWYLPWHEQVYLPWAAAQAAQGGGAQP